MSVTIDLNVLLTALLLIAIIILVIYAILMIRKLIITLNHTNKVLEDVEVISAIASERSKDVNNIVENISTTVSDVSGTLKENKNVVKAVVSVANSIASLRGVLGKNNKDN